MIDEILQCHYNSLQVENAGLRMALAQAETIIERLKSERAILRDSAKDVIAWCDKTGSGDALCCIDRMRHAIAATESPNAEITGSALLRSPG